MKLGVCYYPEHWPVERWAEDAAAMRDLGLSVVRIGEFAWSRIEAAPGCYDWDWLDRAVDTLHRAELSIVMGTPTATPPKWLIDLYPEILPHDAHGHPRRFGSRRHYCFSSPVYRRETARIVEAMARRYGRHPAVLAWQTDNEYGCHDTVLSYTPAALAGFRAWLAERYGTVSALNAAWGTVFWSQEYRDFNEIDLPGAAVTEPHPAHVMDFRRFASDEVVAFNRIQTDILRTHSPGRDILHNFMGFFTDFDHVKLAEDLDIAAWDSYPLGFLEHGPYTADERTRWMRQGHPDFAAFHHDLYRGCGRGRVWVMEQQPGPVNWARNNPSPRPGMVRLWTWEAFAHGCETVSYFRWRQAPFAQEQMHAGLLRPDSTPDRAFHEAGQVAGEIDRLDPDEQRPGDVALIYDYASAWACEIQPHGQGFRHDRLIQSVYGAIRRLGLDVDILPPGAELSGYRMVVIPSMPIADPGFVKRLSRLDAAIVIGPRSGARTRDMQIPETLAPGPFQALMPLKVARVETIRPGMAERGTADGRPFTVSVWREEIETDLPPRAATDDGQGVWFSLGTIHYLAAWPDAVLARLVLRQAAQDAGLATLDLPEDVRIRRTARHAFVFNYGRTPVDIAPIAAHLRSNRLVLGTDPLNPADLAAFSLAT